MGGADARSDPVPCILFGSEMIAVVPSAQSLYYMNQ